MHYVATYKISGNESKLLSAISKTIEKDTYYPMYPRRGISEKDLFATGEKISLRAGSNNVFRSTHKDGGTWRFTEPSKPDISSIDSLEPGEFYGWVTCAGNAEGIMIKNKKEFRYVRRGARHGITKYFSFLRDVEPLKIEKYDSFRKDASPFDYGLAPSLREEKIKRYVSRKMKFGISEQSALNQMRAEGLL